MSEVRCHLQCASVVCTTLTGVLMRDLRDVHFDVAIIDEAAQVPSFPNTSPTPAPSAGHHAGLLRIFRTFSCKCMYITESSPQVQAWIRCPVGMRRRWRRPRGAHCSGRSAPSWQATTCSCRPLSSVKRLQERSGCRMYGSWRLAQCCISCTTASANILCAVCVTL